MNDHLGSTNDDLDSGRHPTGITKTVYPTITDRLNMKMSTMDKKTIRAIIGMIRLVH